MAQETDIQSCAASGDAAWRSQQLGERRKRNEGVLRLLRSWAEGDEEEQRQTWEYLKTAIDEDRLSTRRFYP